MIFKYTFINLYLLLFISSFSNAQIKLNLSNNKNALYFEFNGATGNLYGIGYERNIYAIKKWTFYGKGGFSIIPFKLTIRSGLYNLGAHIEGGLKWGNLRNKLVLGTSFAYYYGYPNQFVFRNPKNIAETDTKFLIFRLGYRRISKRNSWFYDIGFTPYMNLDRYQRGDLYIDSWIEPNFGLGIGIQF